MIVLFVFIGLLALLALSVPIGTAVGISVAVGIVVQQLPLQLFAQTMLESVDSFPILAVPFFILAGEIMQKGAIARRLLDLSKIIIGKITGGMAHVTILTSLFFGALSGSSTATVAAVGGVMIPSMHKDGYKLPFAAAVGTASGCLGVIIPPSILFIIYGAVAGVSVGDLFIAGIIPGCLLAGAFMLTAYIKIKLEPVTIKEETNINVEKRSKVLLESVPALSIPIVVLGGIYGGIMTPTEAGAVAVLMGVVVELFIYRSTTIRELGSITVHAARITSAIFYIIITATVFGKYLLINDIPSTITSIFLQYAGDNYTIVFVGIVIVLLIAGMFMDAVANILILTPIFLPTAHALGINPVHFGVVMVVTISIGFLTPPVGVNLFVGSAISGVSVEKISWHILPFVISAIAVVAILMAIPSLSLILI